MKSPRLVTGLAALAIAGLSFAAIKTTLPFQDAVQPVREHKLVQKGLGDWEGSMKIWMPDQEEPMEMACNEEVWPIGELWTVSHFQATMEGAEFHGSAVLGYDVNKKKFVGTWIDGTQASITEMEGDWNAEKKALVMEYDQTMMGQPMHMRMEHVMNDDNSYTSTFYNVVDGKDMRHMMIEMRRKSTVEAGQRK